MGLEFLYTTELSIPLYQIGLLLLVSTLALLFGRIKVALLTNYLFTLYWGYVLNRETLVGNQFENVSYFTTAYFGFGFVIILIALFAFLMHKE